MSRLSVTPQMRNGLRSRRDMGLTMPEVAVYLTIFFIILVPSVKLSIETTRSYTGQVRVTEQSSRVSQALQRIVSELQLATEVSLLSTAGSIEYRFVTGFTGTVVDLGEIRRLELHPDVSDPVDGVDNDGDGVVDEQWLVLWEDLSPAGATPGPEDPQWVLCESASPNGLTVTRTRTFITIDLSYQVPVEPGSSAQATTVSASVSVRN